MSPLFDTPVLGLGSLKATNELMSRIKYDKGVI